MNYHVTRFAWSAILSRETQWVAEGDFFLGVKSFFFGLEFIWRSCFVTKKTLSVFLSFLGVFCGVLLVKCVFIKHDWSAGRFRGISSSHDNLWRLSAQVRKKNLKSPKSAPFIRIHCFFITKSEISEIFKALQLFSQSLWNQVKRVNRGIGLNVLILTRNSDTEIYSKFCSVKRG